MFRITSHSRDGEFVLKVEGCLAGPCVPELYACWQDAARADGTRRIRVDLTDVWHVGRDGQELMTVMYHAGVQYMARGCVIPELVREIAQSAGAGWRV